MDQYQTQKILELTLKAKSRTKEAMKTASTSEVRRMLERFKGCDDMPIQMACWLTGLDEAEIRHVMEGDEPCP